MHERSEETVYEDEKNIDLRHRADDVGFDFHVSRALQDNPAISVEMRDRIRKTAEEMGYKPNVFAVNLQRGSTRTIGVVVPMVSRNFFSVAIDGIEEAASQRGYDVMIYQSRNDPEREVRILYSFLHGKVDGVIASLASG
ncbi:MAG: LacI family DNA-binding transcriptional regulator, partial [Alistipes sp.]